MILKDFATTYLISAGLLTIGLFLGMLLLLELGHRIGVRRRKRDPAGATAGTGTIDGAIFGLLGLLLAFTFSGAATRFDTRRQLIVQEANAIGTAYLRLDMLSPAAQVGLKENFRRYVDARLDVYRHATHANLDKFMATVASLQGEIWRQSVEATRAEGYQPAAMLLLPALNDMIDITTTRDTTSRTHPPLVIYVMLFGLVLASALLAGYGMAAAKTRSWLHMLGFAATMAIAIYVILDLEFPRLGLVRIDMFDSILVEVRQSMK